MSGPRILFVCDAGETVGGGHVMRCLTLAGALAERGARPAFLRTPAVAEVVGRFGGGAALTDDAAGFEAVVFDHYGLGAEDHRRIAGGRPALVIDDLADRPLAADLVLDAGPARRAQDYAGLVAPDTRLLLGPAYAAVRPAFSVLREVALARRGGTVRRILVSLGLTDVGGITGRVAERLLATAPDQTLDVVVGAGAPSLPHLRALAGPRLALHVDAQDMPRLTLEADLAVGAGGSTTWERCVLGLPSILLILAPNQAPAAAAMAKREAAMVLDVAEPGFEADFDAALRRLLDDAPLRRRLSAASAEVCDGQGAARAAEAFLKVIEQR